jgi:hypothetical protein
VLLRSIKSPPCPDGDWAHSVAASPIKHVPTSTASLQSRVRSIWRLLNRTKCITNRKCPRIDPVFAAREIIGGRNPRPAPPADCGRQVLGHIGN